MTDWLSCNLGLSGVTLGGNVLGWDIPTPIVSTGGVEAFYYADPVVDVVDAAYSVTYVVF